MKRTFFIITVILFISCKKNDKEELIKSTIKNDSLKIYTSDSLQSSVKNDLKIGNTYNSAELSVAGIFINYNNGKYKFEEDHPDFLIDSTLSEDEKYQVLSALNNENLKVEKAIRITDFGVLNVNDKGNILEVLFKKEKKDYWKVVDILNIGKAIDEDEHQYKIEGNRYLSFSCENNQHHQYFGVVINKIDKSGKYEKVLRAFKFDLEKEKIIEVDLKKEKVECFPEIGDE
ncbi:hypothetical protein ACFSJW_08290 [Flavobacterium artemisiae]|uniref:Lipoprotein n=1 Tax=Flavobacterium artemisiae TaxID=2126556 RepID=A0ABW4HFH6_9FLAO